MYKKFRAALRLYRVRLMVWFRLRVLCRSKMESDQYKAIVSSFITHPATAKELLYSAQFIAKLAKMEDRDRDQATINLAASMVTGMFAHDLAETGDETMAKTTMNLARVLSIVPHGKGSGIIGVGFGTALRTMELVGIVRAAAIAAALLADEEGATPQRFLDFVGGGMAGDEQWEKVRQSFKVAYMNDDRAEKEGGTVSQKDADDLEKLFNLGAEEEAA